MERCIGHGPATAELLAVQERKKAGVVNPAFFRALPAPSAAYFLASLGSSSFGSLAGL